MEIRNILSELILSAQNTFNDKGQPDNFDLEDFIYQLESWQQELDDLGEFFYESEDEYEFDDDDYYNDYEN